MSANKVKLSILFSVLLMLLAPCPGTGADTYEDPATGMEFVFIKGGCFQMGSETGPANERPVHTACVGDFFMGKYEVTQGQWKLVMGSNPSFFSDCGDNCPVENLTWADTQEFISRLNHKAGAQKYRLPTEAEWEYAARAGSQARYSYGDDAGDLSEYAWYAGNSGSSQTPEVYYLNRIIRARPHPVGQRKPNALGLYDMHGNVWEGSMTGTESTGLAPRRIRQVPPSAPAGSTAGAVGTATPTFAAQPSAFLSTRSPRRATWGFAL